MSLDDAVERNYSRPGLAQAILDALAATGKDTGRLKASDLNAADEFHLGWHEATLTLARDLDLSADRSLVELGSGLGGPARTFASLYGCRVTGIDLTRDYVDAARELTTRCGLDNLVRFDQGSVLALPYADASFDRATVIHVGMNIADKAQLFAEARRVLQPGGLFAVYDAMRMSRETLRYPMPWAETADTSFVAPVDEYRRLLAGAGLAIEAEHDRSDMVRDLARRMREEVETHGPPPVGLHLAMGPTAGERLANIRDALERGAIAPVAIIARAV